MFEHKMGKITFTWLTILIFKSAVDQHFEQTISCFIFKIDRFKFTEHLSSCIVHPAENVRSRVFAFPKFTGFRLE